MLIPAAVRWQQATPVSASFDDFYFSTDNGLDESRYVFLHANRLPERFQEGPHTQPFIIAETGFGTGLNFLASWSAWRKLSAPKRPLHFFSIEKYPLCQSDLEQALANWPELAECIELLLADYPPLVKGLHNLDFEQGKVRLSLVFGDITELALHQFKADAWYLDGFSPRKNPEMWTANLFETMAQRSQPGTSFSTFTAASDIRKQLQQAGFDIKKRIGFGIKREMLYGTYLPTSEQVSERHHLQNLWSQPAPDLTDATNIMQIKSKTGSYDVAIIGAGLAGLATAYELAQQGLKVCLIDANAAPVQGASGQSQLAMYAKLPSEANKLFHFIIHALCDSFRYYTKLQAQFPDNDELE